MRKVLLIPCLNEALNIEKVIDGFLPYFSKSDIYVFDNDSTDDTGKIAENLGVNVIFSPLRGKGNVVKHMFSAVEADIYVMVDGDLTAFPEDVEKLIAGIEQGYDMVVGDRLSSDYYKNNRRFLHGIGNRFVIFLMRHFYHTDLKDIMSGYRAFNRFFVKNVELTRSGFEVETEMTIWAIRNDCKIISVPVKFRERQKGSKSKVNTIKDGIKIVNLILGEIGF